MPPLACSDAADVLARDQAAADKGAAEHSESKLLVHAYRFLGALASLDPQLFMRSWQLFLTDSIATDNALATAVRAAVQPCVLPAFRSPLLVGASRALPAVRVAAVQCLRSLLTGLPIRKWFRATLAQSAKKSGGSRGYLGDSVASALMKITRFAVLALAVEAHEAVVQELLLLAQALVRRCRWCLRGRLQGVRLLSRSWRARCLRRLCVSRRVIALYRVALMRAWQPARVLPSGWTRSWAPDHCL